MTDQMKFGFDNAPKDLLDSDKPFKMEARGQTERVAIVMFDEDKDGNLDTEHVTFVGGETHFHPDLGMILSSDEIAGLLGTGKARIGTLALIYNTDKNGQPTKPLNFTIVPWYMDKGKFDTLREHNKVTPLAKHDLKIRAPKDKDPKFQNMEFFVQNESIWQMKPELKAKVLSKVRILAKKVQVGRKVTIEEVREKLGVDAPSASTGSESSANFDDLIAGT